MSVGLLVYLAFAFGVLGFLARDELRLRLMMLCANSLYMTYYFFVAERPLWDAIFANTALALVNLWMIGVVLIERTTLGMTVEKAQIYRQFPLLSPGQFRRIMKLAHILELGDRKVLTVEQTPLSEIFYMVSGSVDVTKQGATFTLEGPRFVGEVAFLLSRPASATVVAAKGSRVITWNSADLTKLTKRVKGLDVAMFATLNRDLADKVANSDPTRELQ